MNIRIADKTKEVEKILNLAKKFDVKITDIVFSGIVTSVYNSDFVVNNLNVDYENEENITNL